MPRPRKAPTRSQRKAQLLDAAARVELPPMADVCVLGAGAAGLVAAITAAEAGARVVVLEQAPSCGQSILATGNGRCNLANTRLDPARYNDPAFVSAVCADSWLEDVLRFFADCGLAWEEEDAGRLYPLSRQAASVRNVLLARARRAGVTLAPAREVLGVDRGFVVRLRELYGNERGASVTARAVIVATGGGTAGRYGAFGLRVAPSEPILCPLACDGPALVALDGRRVRARATLVRDGEIVACELGEVLFRTYGLSGIVVFDLSRFAQPGDTIELDLFFHLSSREARTLGAHTLDGLLDPVVAEALVAHFGSRAKALEGARRLSYRVNGPTETNRAQVTRGGLLTSQFDPATLEAHAVAGLYACGEALDVDGPCGGFNLAWAWKSALVAGEAQKAAVSRH